MANRIIYNVQDVFVGPPESISPKLLRDTIVLQRLSRIKSFNYNVNVNRVDISELGNRGTVFSSIVESPEINFQFEYCWANLSNEAKLGFNVNWNVSGIARYTNNTGVSLFSGFADNRRENDCRDFYLVINPNGADIRQTGSLVTVTGFEGSPYQFIDPNCRSYQLLIFNNAYLSSYENSASVGDLLRCNLSYLADNISFFNSGSGVKEHIFEPRTRTLMTGANTIFIPKYFIESGVNTLRPGDINVSFDSPSTMPNLGFRLNDIKLQNYNLSIPLSRKNIEFLGYKAPVDRPLNFPIIGNLDFSMVVGNMESGHITNLINNDSIYNFTITVRNPEPNPPSGQRDALKIIARGAKLQSSSYENAIGTNKTLNLSFKIFINPDNLVSGLFFSGIIPAPIIYRGYLTTEPGITDVDILNTEDNIRLIAEDIPIYPNVF